MPCRSDYMDPTPNERDQANSLKKDFRTMADQLTFACDVLREHLLGETEVNVLPFVNHSYAQAFAVLEGKAKKSYVGVDLGLRRHVEELVKNYIWLNGLAVRGKKGLTSVEYTKIKTQQNEHREADLTRLMKTLADKGDRVRLRKVLDADATKPLEPQLGFSPDDF